MNAAEQKARHTQLTQLASDTAKAFEDMDTVLADLRKDLDQMATDLDDLDTKILDRDLQEAKRVNDLINGVIDAENSGRVHADLDLSLAQRGFQNRGFWARMGWLFLGR